MFFDMGIGELLIIGVVGLIVFGPERLPKVAAQAAQFLRQLKDQATIAKTSIIEAADIDESTLRDLRDLDPRRALRDVASPLDEVRKMATDSVKLEPSRIIMPKADRSPSAEAAALSPASDESTTPDTQKAPGIDYRDVL